MDDIFSYNENWSSVYDFNNIPTPDINILETRPYQYDGIVGSLFKNSKLNLNTAAGKSVIINLRAFEEARQKKQKAIIAVPTLFIGDGFASNDMVKLIKKDENNNIINEGDIYEFIISDKNNLTKSGVNFTSLSKVKRLIDFIKNPITDDAEDYEYVILVSHATLASAFNHMKIDNKLNCIKNVTLHVDEAHRIHYDSDLNANEMGKVISHFFKNSKKNHIFINLVTATYMRNNLESIAKDFNFDFEQFVDVPEYLKYCLYLKGFRYNIKLSSDDYKTAIVKIFKENPNKKTIIYLPHSKFDINEAIELEKMLKNNGRKNLRIERVGVLSEKSNDNEARNKMKKCEIDVILNKEVAREGANWPECSRIIICGIRDSIPALPQRVGRILRDHKSKNDIIPEAIQLICNVDEMVKSNGIKTAYNDILRTLAGMLLMYDMFDGCQDGNDFNNEIKREMNHTELNDEYKVNFMHQIHIRMTQLSFDNENDISEEEIKEVIKEIVGNEYVDYFYKRYTKTFNDFTSPLNEDDLNKRLKMKNLKDIPYDLTSPTSMYRCLMSQIFDIDKFNDFKRAIINKIDPDDEMFERWYSPEWI
jgi:DNA-binding protein